MKKMINRATVAGVVQEHSLEVKQVKNEASDNFGKDFIGGVLSVATDEQGLNVVDIHFTYVTPTTKKGSVNSTYTALKTIIDGGKTVVTDGFDAATKVSVSTAVALNDFPNREGEMVSAKRLEGGFVTLGGKLPDERNKFEFDFLINGIRQIEADPEKHIDQDYIVLKGATFNFRNELLPLEVSVKNPGGIKYFESLDLSAQNPVFTKVWGDIISESIVTKISEESAFGEAAVREVTRSHREYVVTGTSKETYDFGDEAVLTFEEVKKAMADREIHLAEVKKRTEEYQASRNAAPAASATVTAAQGGFNF